MAPEQTVIALSEPAGQPAAREPEPPVALEVRLIGRTARPGGDVLEAITWPAGYSPTCPTCAHPTTGLEEQYARVRGIRELVVVALAQPCGCLVDDHAAALQAGAPNI